MHKSSENPLNQPIEPAHIEVVPPEIIFNDIVPNQTYEMTVLVKNLTNIAKRLRIFQPSSLNFRCDYDVAKGLAPGLALKLLVSFETSNLGEFHDSMRVISDNDFNLEVKLHAYPLRSQITFEPFLNLGFLQLNKEKVEEIVFKNEGKSLGKVELRFEKLPDISIDPNFFTIQPNQEIHVKVTHRPKEAGILKGKIDVIVDGQSFQNFIEVNAIAVDYNRFFIDEKGLIVNKLDFGPVYYGQQKELNIFLLNNTPKIGKFQTKLKSNKNIGKAGFEKYLTPHELGVEEVERVLKCTPDIGIIGPYSQIKIKVTCHPKITEKTQIWTKHFVMMKEEPDVITERFSYTGTCEFDDQTDDEFPNILLQAQAICPQVKISAMVFNFGECPMNDRRDLEIWIENKNPILPIDYDHEATSSFKMTPCPNEILAKSKINCLASFLPKSLGTFVLEFSLYLLKGQYKIPMKLFGKSSTISQKEVLPRGVETIPKDFEAKPKIIEKEQFQVHYHKRKKKGPLLHSFSMESMQNADINSILKENPLLDDETLYKELNKQKYDKYLKDKRKARIKKDYDIKIAAQKQNLNDRFKEIEMIANSQKNTEDDGEDTSYKKTDPPVDIEFVYGLKRTSDTPKLQRPREKDKLFVHKPIQGYEPSKIIESQSFTPNSLTPCKKLFPEKPRNHAEARDCALNLDAAQLQKIFAGPKILEFGPIYVKSVAKQCFSVRNDLKTCIIVRLMTDFEEMKDSFQTPQIIPSTETAHFEIFLTSPLLNDFKGTFKYIINEKYTFEFLVTATIESVRLEPDTKTLKFFFGEESEEMEVIEKFRVKNPGNDKAIFSWDLSENKVFTVDPKAGQVPARQSLDINIIYKPSGLSFGRPEEEKLVMKIQDGLDLLLRCTGIAPESKCSLREINGVDLGEIQISQKKEAYILLKNHLRHPTAFEIIKDFQSNLEIWPIKDKLMNEESKTIKISFCSKEQIEIKEKIITILLKGGKSIKFPFSVKTILPNIEIVEEIFDFGFVTTLGNPGVMKMALRNSSNIKVNLILDMREKLESQESSGIDCLDIELIEPELSKKGDSTVIMNIDQSEEIDKNIEKSPEILKKTKEINMDEGSESSSSDEEIEEESQSKYQRISINPQQTLVFQMKFSPKEVKNYAFQLPLSLEGYGNIETLVRYVTCVGVQPKLLIDPQIVDFKKKIISNDKYQPKKMEITILNSDENAMKFNFDTSDLEMDKVFSIVPSEGVLKAGEQLIIEAFFNPFTQMNYERKAGLFLNGETEKSYIDLTFKGNGAYPKLIFDRREIIMPIVPLNITSRCIFKIINDGFENLMIKHNLPKDIGFHLDITYLEGKNIGVTKNKLKIEALFSSKQPISFTTKLDFIDSDGRSYMIPISGTSDNCIFTNFSYIQRTPLKDYFFKCEPEQPVILEEVINDDSDNLSKKPNDFTKNKLIGTSVLSSKSSAKNIFGCSLIPNEILSSSLENIKRWLNHFVLSSPLQSFPDDVITSNGSQLFDLYYYLSGKIFGGKAKFDLPLKRVEKIAIIINQYDEFLKLLMGQGCLLNTLRPYYLLGYSDFNFYLKIHPVDYLNSNSFRPTAAQFSYISADSWITLFYQIVKIYYLSRISVKSFKKQFPLQKLPDFYLQDSNLYSTHETVLLRWIELYQSDPVCRLTNFDRELKNSIYISNIIQGYINTPSIKGILNLKQECLNSDDLLFNAEKILQALSFIGLETHMQAKNIAYPSARENVLFLTHIYQSLLNYIPKHDPIVFSCILGQEVIKNIELKNPTKKVISFWVKFEGHKDFSIESETLRIEPLGKADFKVKFQSRIFEPVTGRLTFFNKRESNINAAAIVFDLRSEITERLSSEVINIQSQLYQSKQEIITIKNMFSNSSLEFADFNITLLVDKISKENPKKEGKNKSPEKKDQSSKINNGLSKKIKKTQKSGKAIALKSFSKDSASSRSNSKSNNLKTYQKDSNDNKEHILNFLMPTFICSKDKVHLRKGESTQVSLIFLPMVYENYRCRIICCDKDVGEFQIEVCAETLLPEILTDIRPGQNNNPIYVDNNTHFEFNLPFRNENLCNAKKFHENRLATTAKYKENLIKFKQITQNPEEILFTVELNPPSPFITIPNTFLMKDPLKGTNYSGLASGLLPRVSSGGKTMDEENLQEIRSSNGMTTFIDNKLPMDFFFKFPTTGQSHNLILHSFDNTDIRIYRLMVVVIPKMIKGTLKLKCAFGDELKQEIPFLNNTERDWLIRTNIICDNNKYPGNIFSGIRELTIKRKSQGNFILHFHPQNPYEKYEGKLTISNTTTNDHYEYDLIGLTEDPLAKAHITIKCIAQNPEKKIIEIPNPYNDKAVTYVVETDLINAGGINKFSIEPGKIYKYQLIVTPLIGGIYTGSITFYEEAEKQKYIWFTVSVETERSNQRGEIEIRAEIRKSVACDIEIFNPLEENLTFEAIIEGDGLFGDPTITIQPKKTVKYNLTFLPLKVFISKGSISFINEKIGEIWYDINLFVLEKKPEKLPTIKAELGKLSEIKIYLENPSFEIANIKTFLSNTHNFAIYPENMTILALQELEVTIRYIPSNLEKSENGELIFVSDTIGKWEYIVNGIGTPPNKFPSTSISSPIDKDLTQIINFKNPLKEEINVQIILNQEGNGFKLMANKGKVTIPGLTNYQIPYLFLPNGIREYECEIIIHMNDKVNWTYPIKGIGEYVMNDLIYNFKTKSREVFNGDLKLTIPGITENFLHKPFNVIIDHVPEEFVNAIGRCFKITPIKNSLNSLEDHLRFKVIFSPMKPFKVTLDMLLTTNAGGRWKFKLNLEASEPDRDDIIQIYSPLHKTSSVSFKLTNRFKNLADFKAYFTFDSDPEFSVIPKEGTLEPYGKEGSTFIISFTPVEYGKNKNGKLIIETDEIYWSYHIRGTFPQYHPPESHSIINNRLGNEILEKIKAGSNLQKNYLVENIKKSKWNSEEKKRFYNELGLEKNITTEISFIGKLGDYSKEISSILIQEGSKDAISFSNHKRDLLSAKFTEKNEQSTKITMDQSISFKQKNKEKYNYPVYKSYQG